MYICLVSNLKSTCIYAYRHRVTSTITCRASRSNYESTWKAGVYKLSICSKLSAALPKGFLEREAGVHGVLERYT